MKSASRLYGLFGLFLLLTGLHPAAAFGATTFDPALQPTGYVVPPVLSKYDLRSGNETSFQGTFDKEFWFGDVFAYPVDDTGVVNYAAERWGGAAYHINGQNYDTGRKIVTMNGSSKVPFRWASLSTTQQTALGSSGVLNYIRGDRSNENAGLNLRPRKSVLGDIMHSRPYMYDGLLYIGANDGMVHVINVENAAAAALTPAIAPGGEVYAYIPSMLIPKLTNLTVGGPDFSTNPYVHTYFCDGPLGFNVIDVGGVTKKILVGTLGAGGKGLFALDVTSPVPSTEASAASNILWEKKAGDTGYANLGYTYSMPSIVKVHNGAGVVVSAVIIGNGYVNTGNGHATLLVVNLADGSVIREIDTASGTVASPNGLSSPTVVDSGAYSGGVLAGTAPDDVADFVFAGDIDGNMWKFNLTGDTPSSWSVSSIFSAGRAITSAPAVGQHPNGGFIVDFATGRMLTTADVTDTAVNYAYGIWDTPGGNTTLVSQTLTAATYVSTSGTSTAVRTATILAPNWNAGGDKGWRTALPAGERVVGDGAFISSGRFYFMSTNPTIAYAPTDPPTNTPVPQGDNWLMELDYKTGGGSTTPFLDLSGDLALTDADRVKSGGTPIPGAPGVPVGKFAGHGVNSQPVLVKLVVLNTALYNNHPDIVVPAPPADRGVSGGHFDFDIIYYTATGCTTSYVTDSTYTCAGLPSSCASYVPYTVPPTYQESCSNANSGTTTHTCPGQLSTCSASSPVYTLPPNVTESCSSASTNGSTYTCPGKHASPDSCSTYTPYTIPSGSTDVCTQSSATSTKTCVGNHVSPDSCQTYATPTYTLTSAQTESCALGADGALAGTYTCSNNYSGDFPGPTTNTGCIGHTPTPNYTSVPAGSHQICTYVGGGTKKTTCKVYPYSTTCTITTWTTSCQIKNWTTTCTNGTYTTTCLLKKPVVTCTSHPFNYTHVHEYDKIYDVTGVNMLNASNTSMNISKVITSTSTPFKILVANQALNPASSLTIGGAAYVKSYTYDTSASLSMAALPTYTRATVNSLAVNLDVHAFTAKDWGTGEVRAGVMPTNPECVWDPTSQNNNKGSFGGCKGPGGTQRSGVLTIQVVKDTTPDADVQRASTIGPSYGYRLKDSAVYDDLLVEYVIWWHHPLNGDLNPPASQTRCANDDCCPYSYTGVLNPRWVDDPPLDLTAIDPSVFRTPAAGSTDPKIGSFRSTDTIISIVTTVTANVMTTVTTYNDGTHDTVVRTHNSDNTYTITTTDALGNVTTITTPNLEGSVDRSGEEAGSAGAGRISWRELGN